MRIRYKPSIVSCSFMLFSMLISPCIFAATTSVEIQDVLLANLYLDGGTVVVVGETVGGNVFYIHASPNGRDDDVAFIGSKDLSKDPKYFISLLDGLSEWALKIIDIRDPVEIFKEYAKGREVEMNDLNAVLVYGFVEAVCASVKFESFKYEVASARACNQF